MTSTNQVLADRARDGAPVGSVIVAEYQSAGRGRRDRTWVSPPRAGLMFSVLARPVSRSQPAGSAWSWLPLAAGLGVLEGVVAAGGPRCVLKWPNDLMYDGLKLAGLLAEQVETPSGPSAVVGIGLNVTTTRAELPVPTASSLRLAGWTGVDRTALLPQILACVGDRLGLAGADVDLSELRRDYTSRCESVGSEVSVDLGNGTQVHGRVTGIGPDGALVMRESDGTERSHHAGDVVHLRRG